LLLILKQIFYKPKKFRNSKILDIPADILKNQTQPAGCGGLLLAPGPGDGGGAATAGHRARGGVDRMGCETKGVSMGCVFMISP